MQDLPWHNIWSADNPVKILNAHLFLLVRRFVPTKVILVRSKDEPWFDDQCRHAFGLKQEAHPVSSLVEIKWFQIVSLFQIVSSWVDP